MLQAVDAHPVSSYADIERRSHISTSSIQNYATDNDKLAACMVKEPKGGYQLTPIGEKALERPWDEVAP